MTDIKRKHALGKCEACPLQSEKNTYVPSIIPADATIAFVGEAPGYKEKQAGVPFSGPSGKLLDTVLAEHNIDRGDVILTNVCLCRPPDNANVPKEAVAACADRLTFELAQTEKIVALGGAAITALLDDSKLKVTTSRIGAPKRNPKRFPQAEIIPTFHPAACLRAADNFPYLVNDIGKLVGKNYIGYVEPDYFVPTNAAQAEGAIDSIYYLQPEYICIDIETKYDKDGPVQPSHLIEPLCIGIGYAADKVIVLPEHVLKDEGVLDALKRLLLKFKIIAQNGKYDVAWLQQIAPGCKLSFDTMLASYCYDERPGTHGLGYLGMEILGTPNWKAEAAAWGGTLHMPKEELHKYNAWDVAITWQLADYYQKLFSNDLELAKLHDFLVAASNEMMLVEREGVLIDTDFLAELEIKFQKELQLAESAMKEWIENPRSPKQVAEVFTKFGYKEDSTDAATLMRLIFKETGLSEQLTRDDLLEILDTQPEVSCKNERVEFLWRLLAYRKEQKLYGTYVKGTRKRLYNSRLYPTFLLHGTTTGRLSCRNPNVQNIPRGSSIRNLFIPKEGNVFVQGDYAQAELRTIASLSEDKYLRQVFSEGRDIHSEVAKEFFGDNFTKEHRVKAKMVVFGLSYDMSAKGLAERMGISKSEGQKFLNKFFEVIPEVDAWRKDVIDRLFVQGVDLTTPFGRRRRFMLITKENQDDIRREGLAFLPQSIASDICLTAFTRLRPLLAGVADFRITVHDSLLAECKQADRDFVAKVMKAEMEAASLQFTKWVPFNVDIQAGYSWGSLKELEIAWT